MKNGMRPVHPGEVLDEEYLVPLGMSATELSRALNVSSARVRGVAQGERRVTPDTANRLALFFGGDAQSWLNLQSAYDLKTPEMSSRRIAKRSPRQVPPGTRGTSCQDHFCSFPSGTPSRATP